MDGGLVQQQAGTCAPAVAQLGFGVDAARHPPAGGQVAAARGVVEVAADIPVGVEPVAQHDPGGGVGLGVGAAAVTRPAQGGGELGAHGLVFAGDPVLLPLDLFAGGRHVVDHQRLVAPQSGAEAGGCPVVEAGLVEAAGIHGAHAGVVASCLGGGLVAQLGQVGADAKAAVAVDAVLGVAVHPGLA